MFGLIAQDERGTLRYVYENGSLDPKSIVDPRTPHLLIDENALEALAQKATETARAMQQAPADLGRMAVATLEGVAG